MSGIQSSPRSAEYPCSGKWPNQSQSAAIMSSAQMALEYLLVYCTSHGLTSIGEPPLPKTYRPVGDSLVQTQRSPNHSTATKDAMPVWIIFIFLSLATMKYIFSFAVSPLHKSITADATLIYELRFGTSIKSFQQSSSLHPPESGPLQQPTPKGILTLNGTV